MARPVLCFYFSPVDGTGEENMKEEEKKVVVVVENSVSTALAPFQHERISFLDSTDCVIICF